MAKCSYFELFEREPAFELDQAQLAEVYRRLARDVHPDRFVQAGEAEQRQAVERSADLNEAYRVLRSDSARARYLLSLSGAEMELEATVHDPEFLFQQMQWREELEEIRDRADIDAIAPFRQRLRAAATAINTEFASVWQNEQQRAQAERLVRRMQFLDKLALEVRDLEERLDD